MKHRFQSTTIPDIANTELSLCGQGLPVASSQVVVDDNLMSSLD
jgi:hypothetical protein